MELVKSYLIVSLLFITAISYCTSVPAGSVSGIWLKSESPYRIEGDIAIDSGTSLIIEPGVDVLFNGNYSLTIVNTGHLRAEGTEEDSISFTTSEGISSWEGMKFTNDSFQNDSSLIKYCFISNAHSTSKMDSDGGAIHINQYKYLAITNTFFFNNKGANGGAVYSTSRIRFEHNQFENCVASDFGGAVYMMQDNIINNCTFVNNQATNGGGAIFSPENSHLSIKNNYFLNNSSFTGGAIYAYDSLPFIINNDFEKNSVLSGGGGAISITKNGYLTESLTITGNKFKQNISTTGNGGAVLIYCSSSQSKENNLINNLFVENEANEGSGLWSSGLTRLTNNTFTKNKLNITDNFGSACYLTYKNYLINNIIYDNDGKDIYLKNSQESNISYSNIENGLAAFQFGSGTEFNGTYENNIDTDPLFLASGDAPYQLAANSPCKNAGTEDASGLSLPDLDLMGNPRIFGRIDMGAYELPNQVPVINSYTPIEQSFTALVDQIVDFSVDATDSDSETLAYSWSIDDIDQNINLNIFSHEFIPGGNRTVKVIVTDGELSTSRQWQIIASQAIENNTPQKTELLNCYPNPFNPSTTVNFSMQNNELVTASLYNTKGQMVKKILNKKLESGYHSLKIDAGEFTSGIYLLRMRIGDNIFSRNLNLLK